MKLKQYPKRIFRKLMKEVTPVLPWDWLTGTRIHRRGDVRSLGSKQGSWSVPMELLHRGSVCYLAGCGEDISFDLALIQEIDCDVHGFDPTPRAIDYVNKAVAKIEKYHFYPVGLWDETTTLDFFPPQESAHVSHSLVNLHGTAKSMSVPVKALHQLMSELGHSQLDLLKLDIEGAEYRVIDSLISRKIRARILCIEYDEFFTPIDPSYVSRIKTSVRKLTDAGYMMVYSAGNANYTFVHRDRL